MLRLLTFCLSLCLISACTEKHNWYHKNLENRDKPALAQSVLNGVAYSYQGSVADQFQILEAIELDSSNGDFWREMGTARVKRGIADEMQFYYGKAASLKPDPWMGFRGYLYLYFYRDYKRAIVDFDWQDSITGSINNSQGQDHDYMRGLAYYGATNYPKAQFYFKKYIERIGREVGPEWVDCNAHLYLALCELQHLNDMQAAYESLESMLAIFPESADAHYYLAQIAYSQGRFKQAREYLNQAETSFENKLYHFRPYVEVLDQIYYEDLASLSDLLTERGA